MKRINNFVLWMFFIIYEEIIFSISVFNSIKSSGYIILLSAMFAVILNLLTSIKRKISIVLSYIFTIIIIGIFIAQFIYYNIYQAIISFYSATNAAGQILQFFTTILETAINKWYIMVLFVLPIIGLIILHRKDKVKFENVKLQQKLITIIIGLIAQITALICIISTNTNEIYSSRNLYYNVNAPTISANKFGILTTMRLDLRRLLFGFEEKNTLVTGEGTLVKQENIDREIQFNSLDIDWNNLINNETNPNITSIYEYMSKQEPSKKNEYTGMFEGKNLIVFVAEAFTDLAIDENITPTLYKLYSKGFQFDNLYTPLFPVSTADGEYMTDTSLIPKEGTWSLEKVEKNYMPYSYANVFEKLGYSSQAYHNHTATYYNRHKYLKGMGYDLYLAKGNGLEEKMNLNNWPSSDL